MLNLLRASALAAAVVFLGPPAKAEDDAPQDTATFVSFCATNFEACRNEVVTVSNYNMMSQLTGSAHPGCTFLHSTPVPPATSRATYHADSIVATHAIIDWLKANSTAAAPKTDESISQAMKALWPSECAH